MTPEEIDLTTRIGRRLRGARTAQKLSLSVLAAKPGKLLSKSRISNYEQGLRRPGLEQAHMLARALGTVSAAYLLCLDDEGFLSDHERSDPPPGWCYERCFPAETGRVSMSREQPHSAA